MNPETLLNHISVVIEQRPVSPADKYFLIYYEGRIRCVPRRPLKPNTLVLGVFTDEYLRAGLTDKDWTIVVKKLVPFFERIII